MSLNNADTDYYAILGVDESADATTIKSAYRRLVMQWHPDRMPPDKADIATARFKEIQAAYDVLSDEVRRDAYDLQRTSGWRRQSDRAGSYDYDFDLNGRTYPAAPGADVQCYLTIPIETAIFGGEAELNTSIKVRCPECEGDGTVAYVAPCHACGGIGKYNLGGIRDRSCFYCDGTGHVYYQCRCTVCKGKKLVAKKIAVQVKIPPGTMPGHVLRIKGLGSESLEDGPRGNIMVTVKLRAHPKYRVAGMDLQAQFVVDFPTALLGGSAEYTWFQKTKLTVPITEMTKHGSKVTIPSRGLYDSQTEKRGDLHLTLTLTLPKSIKKLTQLQRQVLVDMFRSND